MEQAAFEAFTVAVEKLARRHKVRGVLMTASGLVPFGEPSVFEQLGLIEAAKLGVEIGVIGLYQKASAAQG